VRLVISIAVAGALALAASPAVALPPQAADNAAQGQANRPATPGPGASAESKRKAYGKFCQNQSKKHVEGQKGTPFSQCVTAMAKAANSESTSPREACQGMSKKRVEGEKQTPFSKCVSAAAKLKRELRESGS
jgi:hypothetical protein